MKDIEFEMVQEFMDKFFPDELLAAPGFPAPEISQLRMAHLLEEIQELQAAIDKQDLEQYFDALVDLVYVALGTAALSRLPFNEGFARVHAANMKKIRALTPNQSKRGSLLDVYKPKGWLAPDLKALLDLDRAEERLVDCD